MDWRSTKKCSASQTFGANRPCAMRLGLICRAGRSIRGSTTPFFLGTRNGSISWAPQDGFSGQSQTYRPRCLPEERDALLDEIAESPQELQGYPAEAAN